MFELIRSAATLVTDVITAIGYPGIFLLMILESMVFPLPSELVMPFAGFLVAQGEMNFMAVIIASTTGSLTGSLVSYYIGKCGGEPLIRRYGKYFLIDSEDLQKTEQWFRKKGQRTVLLSRMIPVVRHFISIPAGMAKMPLLRFSLYTVLGALLWNGILTEAGVLLGIHWDRVHVYLKPVSIVVAIGLLLVAGHFVYKHVHTKRSALKR